MPETAGSNRASLGNSFWNLRHFRRVIHVDGDAAECSVHLPCAREASVPGFTHPKRAAHHGSAIGDCPLMPCRIVRAAATAAAALLVAGGVALVAWKVVNVLALAGIVAITERMLALEARDRLVVRSFALVL